MIRYKKLSECSLEEVVRIWNKGFEGYYVNISMSLPVFLTRAANEGLSLEHSLAAYEDGQPVGLVVNGFREIAGTKVAWNGGTGIVPDYRGKGIGKQLMNKTLELYREEGVHIATLEALSQNERAIRLYRSVGYEVADELLFLQHSETLDMRVFDTSGTSGLSIRRGLPREVRALPFYRALSAWQTQWSSIKDGESLLVLEGEEVVGYALFKRLLDENDQPTNIILYHCDAHPERRDAKEIVKLALREVFQPSLPQPCKRSTSNFRKSNRLAVELLEQAGFAPQVQQVWMTRAL
jgi:GNAT superfamily N-acetyltransferase